MRQELIKTINALDASANHNGDAIPAKQLFAASVQVLTTGTAIGACKIQFSNDIVNPTTPNGAAPTNWVDIPNASVTISSAGLGGIAKTDLCYAFIRIVWTKNTGSGNVTVIVNAQSV